jgi:hypothetical protein
MGMCRELQEARRILKLWDWLIEMRCTLQRDSLVGRQPWCVLDVDGDVIGRAGLPVAAVEAARANVVAAQR